MVRTFSPTFLFLAYCLHIRSSNVLRLKFKPWMFSSNTQNALENFSKTTTSLNRVQFVEPCENPTRKPGEKCSLKAPKVSTIGQYAGRHHNHNEIVWVVFKKSIIWNRKVTAAKWLLVNWTNLSKRTVRAFPPHRFPAVIGLALLKLTSRLQRFFTLFAFSTAKLRPLDSKASNGEYPKVW